MTFLQREKEKNSNAADMSLLSYSSSWSYLYRTDFLHQTFQDFFSPLLRFLHLGRNKGNKGKINSARLLSEKHRIETKKEEQKIL